MKLLLQRVGTTYVYICPYRHAERTEILSDLNSGNYVVVEIRENIITHTDHVRHLSSPLPSMDELKKNSHTLDLSSIDYIDQINSNMNQMTADARADTLRSRLGLDITEEDVKFAKNPGLFVGPNGEKPAGRLVTLVISGKKVKYLLNNDLTLTDWEIAKQPKQAQEENKQEGPIVTTPKESQPEIFTNEFLVTDTKTTPDQDDILAQLATLEKSGKLETLDKSVKSSEKLPEAAKTKSPKKFTTSEKAAADFMDAIADKPIVEFDEDKAFSDLESDLASLDSTGNGLESLELIEENTSTSEHGDGQDSQVNTEYKSTPDSDNSVVLEDDQMTVTIRYEGSIFRKKFKSDVVAKRQAASFAEMMNDPTPGMSEILNGPASIFTKVG